MQIAHNRNSNGFHISNGQGQSNGGSSTGNGQGQSNGSQTSGSSSIGSQPSRPVRKQIGR